MISQAVAFNLFLAFFPALLIAVGLATSPIGGQVGERARSATTWTKGRCGRGAAGGRVAGRLSAGDRLTAPPGDPAETPV